MQTDVEHILSNLHVLGSISHNDKLTTNNDVFAIYSPTSFRGLYRYWQGEGRDNNLMSVRKCVRSAMVFIEEVSMMIDSMSSHGGNIQMCMNKHRVHYRRMLDALHVARRGLCNLLMTYKDDAAAASRVTLIIQDIDDFHEIMRPWTHNMRRTDEDVPERQLLYESNADA